MPVTKSRSIRPVLSRFFGLVSASRSRCFLSQQGLLSRNGRRHSFSWRWFQAVLILLLVWCLGLPTEVQAAGPREVKVGIYNSMPLVGFSEGKAQGLYVEVLEQVATEEGWRLSFVAGTWDQCLARLESGAIDLLPSIAYSRQRAEKFDFTSEFLFLDWGLVYTRNGSPIQTIFDLEGMTVSALKGSIYTQGFHDLLDQFGIHAEILELGEYTEVFAAIEDGRSQAGINSQSYGMRIVGQYDLERTQIYFSPVKLRFAVKAGHNAALLDRLDQHLKALKQDRNSLYYQRLEFWMGQYGARASLPDWIYYAALLLGGSALILTGFVVLLKKTVKYKTEQLRQSEQRFRSAVIDAPFPIMIHSEDGEVITINKVWTSLTGYRHEEIPTIDAWTAKAYGIEQGSQVKQHISALYALDGPKNEGEYTICTRDGRQIVWAFSSSSLGQFSDGRELVMSMAMDMTEHQANAARIEALAKFPDENPYPVLRASRTGELLYANRASFPLLHKKLLDVGQPLTAELAELLTAAVADEEVQCGEISSGERWFSFSVVPVQDQDYANFYGTEITRQRKLQEERRRLEEQMLHAQKLESLGVLAGGIAHDFNNILMAVMGNADLALMRLGPESPAVDNLRQIEKAAGKATDLARQMLAYSGKGKFVVESLDLNRLIEEMLHMLEVSISKNVVLRFNYNQHLPAIEADATQIRQVLMNLVINASEAIGERSGVIAISTGAMDCDRDYLRDTWLDEDLPAGLYVYFEIADTGHGMDRETVRRVFDPFFTTKFTGRGLGMAAVLGIARGHKGAIKVYSEPGKGTTFKVLLPASGKPVALFDVEQLDSSWQGSGKVLLVDDEETVRAVGKSMLEELGFEVVSAADGREALAQFRKHSEQIQLVLMDLTMPHLDGEQTFRELRRIVPDVKVIMTSGYNEQEVTQKFVGKGLSGFLQKPFRVSMLRDAIQAIEQGTAGSFPGESS
jgi:PAS domain S-box-containing protein